ncbi:hypothetical protein BB560_005031 [Smittium megazygosporum]|uniref:sphinganine-1-phosphate aldolase n=1 Tax=Smittium megazygosporum TaxID=133381 RepID=A0A2T9Z7R6_9FUNG|nr:hypothetical protein BB560_005031 [Smittium megazygosporum]
MIQKNLEVLASKIPPFFQGSRMLLFGQMCAVYLTFKTLNAFRRDIMVYGFLPTMGLYFKEILKTTFQLFNRVPSVRKEVDTQVQKIIDDMKKEMVDSPSNSTSGAIIIPESGFDDGKILNILMKRMEEGKIDWKKGRVSGAIYHGGKQMIDLTNQAMSIFNVTNPLHPDVFPGLRRIEAEVVSMTLEMFHAPEDGCGTVTSGGTESILMSVRAHLERAKKEKNVKKPNLVAPVTAHTAFHKACDYFGIDLVLIPVDEKTGRLVGSAVNYPHGAMDDIVGLANLAKYYDIGMHVDCCLGSFVIAFMEDAGFKTDPFDFRVPGYGFAPKGTSVIMYSNSNLRKYQYFVTTRWPGGIYASPTIPGSRPGSLIAGCWAAMVSMGKKGYIQSCKDIVNSRIKIQKGIESIPGLKIVGDPVTSVVAFGAVEPLNIYSIKDCMTSKGWGLSTLQYPPALHMACTRLTVGAEDQLIDDLRNSVQEVNENPESFAKGSAAMYGTAVSLPDDAPLNTIASGFLDALYEI